MNFEFYFLENIKYKIYTLSIIVTVYLIPTNFHVTQGQERYYTTTKNMYKHNKNSFDIIGICYKDNEQI